MFTFAFSFLKVKNVRLLPAKLGPLLLFEDLDQNFLCEFVFELLSHGVWHIHIIEDICYLIGTVLYDLYRIDITRIENDTLHVASIFGLVPLLLGIKSGSMVRVLRGVVKRRLLAISVIKSGPLSQTDVMVLLLVSNVFPQLIHLRVKRLLFLTHHLALIFELFSH